MSDSAFGRRMEAVDYLMFRGEHDPRSRTAMLSVALLDVTPDFERVRAAFERASRSVLRLRQHVVVPTLPVADPQWIVDPDFDLDYHLRRVRLSGEGTLRDLLDFAQPILSAPLDTARPLWEAYLVEGLGVDGAEAALVLKLNHAITDGLGGVQLFLHLYDFDRDADRGPLPLVPSPEDVTGDDLVRSATRRAPVTLVATGRRAIDRITKLGSTLARDPERSVRRVAEIAGSARRVVGQPPAPPSPLLRRRGLGRRFETLEFPLADFRRAAKSAGGSVNDAYISALCGVMRRYHTAQGVELDAMPFSLPVSLRTDDDPVGGNRFAGARIAAPVGEPDPAKRIGTIRELVTTAAGEPAIKALSVAAPLLARLPTPLLTTLAGAGMTTDVQASNVPGYPDQPYVAGARIVATWGFGPLPGVPMMIVLVSQAGVCYVGVHYDTAAVREPDLFARCLREGFDEVLALDPEHSGTRQAQRANKRSTPSAASKRPARKRAAS
jgi:WS/DGAT/MGAT family acyltransferase